MSSSTALLTRRTILSGVAVAALPPSAGIAQVPTVGTAGVRQPSRHARGGRPPPGLKDRIKAQNRAAAAIDKALRADADFVRSLSALDARILSTEANPPSRFDWRDTNHVTPVRDQQACGSCWVFAAIGAFEASYSIINNESVHVSEQEALDCTFADNNCVAGGWHEVVFLYLQLEGEVGDDSYGYNHVKGLCASNIDRLYFALNWGYVRQEGTPDDVMIPPDLVLKQAIQRYGPIASGVSSTVQSATPDVQRSANWDRYFKRYDDGQMNPNWPHDFPNAIFTGAPSNTLKPDDIDHEVLIVGWDDSLGDHGAWIIKNSWGTNWGDEGYIKLAYGTNNIGFAASWVVAKPKSGPSVSLLKNLVILNQKNELRKFYPQLGQLR